LITRVFEKAFGVGTVNEYPRVVMRQNASRRRFLKSAGLTVAGLGLAGGPLAGIEPFQRRGLPRFGLSLAAYSFRDYFKDSGLARGGDSFARRLDMFGFVDYCAEHGCDGAEVTSYYFPKDVGDDYLVRLRRHAFLRGIALSGTAVGNEFTNQDPLRQREQVALVKAWVDRAALLGVPHIRIFAGNARGVSREEARRLAIGAIEESADYAGRRGIMLGLENHGGIVAEAEDLLDIIRAVKSPWLGVNLDTGNFHSSDPYADLARCAPYAINVHYKVEIQRRGQKKEPADPVRVVKLLREANYQGYVALEYEAEPDAWEEVPLVLERLKRVLLT
jgi:sugar phosphate isomerase/epimerase